MVDIKYLKSKGIWSGAYKPIFTAERADQPPRIRKLIDLLSRRVTQGRTMNLQEWQSYHAIDIACEVDYNQSIPTLVQNIVSRNLDRDQTLQALKDFGLSNDELFLKVQDDRGVTQNVPNAPVLYQMLVPIVTAYCKTVLGQIYNERNTVPLLRYQPLKETTRNRILTEIITFIVQTISTNYGYAAVLRQGLDQMLRYGLALSFPLEEWHCEKQVVDGETITVKEGIRYAWPHPTKMSYDLSHPLTSLNTNTGTGWLNHWRVLTYGDILDNPIYWNRRKIFCGTNWFQSPMAGNYFSEIFPCTMEFPCPNWGRADREQKANWYTTADRDKAVFVTEQFFNLIPSVWGLGDYKYPVWHRFTMAGDDTVLWAAPCAYVPSWFLGYDYDQNAARNPSLALQLLPWQHQIGNIVSQILLTAKQNLLDVTYYDTNAVDLKDIKRFENLGERRYRGKIFIPYDSLKARMAQYSQKDAFIPVPTRFNSIQEMMQALPMCLNLMERILQITAQDTGAAASHQQSKAEILQTGGASKNRRALTACAADEGTDAWKRQLSDGFGAYGDAGVSAQVSAEIEDLDTHLAEIGFKTRGKGEDKVSVTGHKRALKLEAFAATSQAPQQSNDKEIAQALMLGVQNVSTQEGLAKEVGVKNILRMIERAVILSGGPKDFKLPISKDAKGQPQITPEMAQALQQLQQSILQTVEEKVVKPSAEATHKIQSEVDALNQTVASLQKIFDIAKAQQDKVEVQKVEVQSKIQTRTAEARAEEARKNVAFRAEETRKKEKHDLEMRILAEKKHAEIVLDTEKAKADIHIQHKKAAAAPKPAAKKKTAKS